VPYRTRLTGRLIDKGARRKHRRAPANFCGTHPLNVMAGHSRPKDGVASLAYVPAIHALLGAKTGVDARHKAGHDEL
jgi:hypothetical protein